MLHAEPLGSGDRQAITEHLRRSPRGLLGVAYRCPCGKPAVAATSPRLDDGTPFPTLYYVTCPRLNARLSTLESSGLMRELEQRLGADEAFAGAYRRAHQAYLRDRGAVLGVAEIEGVSVGGMPDRVKCLHALAGHALAVGPGVNPVGDAALEGVGQWWQEGPCG